MKLSYSILFAISMLLLSCKKKNTTVDTPEPTPSPTPTPTSFYGIFTTGNSDYSTGGVDVSDFSTMVSFSNKAVSYYSQSSAIYAGKVLLNSDSLSYYSSGGGTSAGGEYYGNIVTAPTSEVWDVAGGNGIPRFTYTNSASYPAYTIVGGIPNTIVKSKGLTITINDVSNMSQGSLLLADGSSSSKGTFVATLKAGNNSITISPATLSSMATTTAAIISIYTDNNKVVNFSGKDFQFIHNKSTLKTVTITP